jgi:hypothetical protein
LAIHRDFNSQSGSPLGSVWAHSRTLSYTHVSMKCDFRVSFSVRTFASPYCCNLNLGLATNAKACKVVSQEGSLRVTSHAPESVGKCEGMNPHTPKRTPTLEVGIPMDSQIYKEQLRVSKPIGSRSSLYHWKSLGT